MNDNTFRLSTLESVLFISMVALFVLAIWVISRHISAARHARTAMAPAKEYRSLADEYRRLTDLGVRIDEIRDQLEQMQRILKEVE